MSDRHALGTFLAGARVDAAVFALRPDYRAMLLAVDGLVAWRRCFGVRRPGYRG